MFFVSPSYMHNDDSTIVVVIKFVHDFPFSVYITVSHILIQKIYSTLVNLYYRLVTYKSESSIPVTATSFALNNTIFIFTLAIIYYRFSSVIPEYYIISFFFVILTLTKS